MHVFVTTERGQAFVATERGINICVDDILLKGRSYINQSKSVLLSADVGKTSDLVAY